MDNAAASRIAHGDLALMNPLSSGAVDETIERLDLPRGGRVLDVGCGRAELLRRVARRWDVRALGYDADSETITEARARAPGLELRVANAAPPGPFDLALCVGSSHALGGYPKSLGALRELVAPGGQVLLGEGYWMREPSPAYLDALGGSSSGELASYPELMQALEQAGLRPLYASVASQQDWDRYEWSLIANAERWAAAHSGDSGAELLRERADRARRRMSLPEGRDTLGFALVLARRDAPRAPNRAARERV